VRFTLIFEKSPLVCRRRGIFYKDKEEKIRKLKQKRENKKIEVKRPISVPNPTWFPNPRIDTALFNYKYQIKCVHVGPLNILFRPHCFFKQESVGLLKFIESRAFLNPGYTPFHQDLSIQVSF